MSEQNSKPDLNEDSNVLELSIDDLQTGNYILKIQNGNQTKIERFVKIQ